MTRTTKWVIQKLRKIDHSIAFGYRERFSQLPRTAVLSSDPFQQGNRIKTCRLVSTLAR